MNYHSDQLSAVKTGAELLGVVEGLGLFTVTKGTRLNEEDTPSFVTPLFELEEATLARIHTAMYMPPMIVEPLPWYDNQSGGLYTQNSSCILGSGNSHQEEQSLDVLNILQDIPWKFTSFINEAEPDAKPIKVGEDSREYRRRVQQHNSRKEHSRFVYSLMEPYSKFYFIWKYDKRGRQYSQGYDINLQGSEYKKACIEFATEELVNGI